MTLNAMSCCASKEVEASRLFRDVLERGLRAPTSLRPISWSDKGSYDEQSHVDPEADVYS
jgi:hypothetical protein